MQRKILDKVEVLVTISGTSGFSQMLKRLQGRVRRKAVGLFFPNLRDACALPTASAGTNPTASLNLFHR